MKIILSVIYIMHFCLNFGQKTLGEIYEKMTILPWMNNLELFLTTTSFTAVKEFPIYISRDSNKSLDITISNDFNSFQSINAILFSCENGYQVHVDTNFIEHFQFLNANNQVQDTFRIRSVLKKYLFHDTVYTNTCPTSSSGLMSKNFTNMTDNLTLEHVTHFNQDTSYVILKNSLGYLTILKVWQHHSTRLHILETRTDERIEYFQNMFCFPNPVQGLLKFAGSFERIQVHSLDGHLVLDISNLTANPEISLENLTQGVYIVSVFNDGRWRYNKVVNY